MKTKIMNRAADALAILITIPVAVALAPFFLVAFIARDER